MPWVATAASRFRPCGWRPYSSSKTDTSSTRTATRGQSPFRTPLFSHVDGMLDAETARLFRGLSPAELQEPRLRLADERRTWTEPHLHGHRSVWIDLHVRRGVAPAACVH